MKLLFSLLLICSISQGFCQPLSKSGILTDFNFNWKFSLENKTDFASPKINDQKWKDVRLPHDWSVSFPFDSIKGEGATGYLLGGIGWYRKHFESKASKNQQTYILFDGVYNNSTVFVNGNEVGFHPYGYSAFYYDITKYLNTSGDNVIAVKVDHSRYADSRWYTGSGIYRDVKLVIKDKLQIPIWGTFATTPEVSTSKATVNLNVEINNYYQQNKNFNLETKIFDAAGNQVGTKNDELSLNANQTKKFEQDFKINQPKLWNLEQPHQYKAITTIKNDGQILDTYETLFGIRSLQFDAKYGFFLNGISTKVKGVCLHHDAGLVGTAVPKEVWRRRFEKLKEAGVNAIRVSHNPASTEFLDLCDEMGFLVQEEFFDEWDYPKDKRLNMKEKTAEDITDGYHKFFHEWGEKDLKSVVLRDRNHPSIFQWSIGNEIEWTYPRYRDAIGYFDVNANGNYFWTLPPLSPKEMKKRFDAIPPLKYELAKTAKMLSKWTKEIDISRPVTANLILPAMSHLTGYTDALDVVGYSYGQVVYDYGHNLYPEKPLIGNESLGQWHEYKSISERPFIAGTFYWTGIDYMGEVNKQWPVKALSSGLLDLAGFEKASFHFMKTVMSDKPHIYITTQLLSKSLNELNNKNGEIQPTNPNAWKRYLWKWYPVNNHWNYKNQEMISVEVYANSPQVELYLNGKSLGRKSLADFDDHVYKWAVPFTDGTITAKGLSFDNQIINEKAISTSSKPSTFEVKINKSIIKADAYDVAHVEVQLVDKNGNPVFVENRHINFEVTGPAKILGVDNGAPDNVQNFQSNQLMSSQGRCLMILQSLEKEGEIIIKVKSIGLQSIETKIKSVK